MEYSYGASSALSAAAAIPSIIIGLVVCIIGIVATWKIFTKAGEEGWKSIVPFLNLYTIFKC